MFEKEIEKIAEKESEILVSDLIKKYEQEIDLKIGAQLMAESAELKNAIDNLIEAIEVFTHNQKFLQGKDYVDTRYRLENQRDLVYSNFFKVQNLMNSFLGQKIVITYVQIDPITGRREIRIMDNDIKNIEATSGINKRGKTYTSLQYQANSHYQKLKNSLPKEKNEDLQNIAANTTYRYQTYKGRVMWKPGKEWFGYKFYNLGPINEAYVNFYVHNIIFTGNLEQKINRFMQDASYGVITADNANGFFIGDTSVNGVQFATKGIGGGPQGYTNIIKDLRILQENFSTPYILEFLEKFKTIEKEKATPLIKEQNKKSIKAMVKYHTEEKLLKPILSINKNLTK